MHVMNMCCLHSPSLAYHSESSAAPNLMDVTPPLPPSIPPMSFLSRILRPLPIFFRAVLPRFNRSICRSQYRNLTLVQAPVHVYISTGGLYGTWTHDSIKQRFQRVFGDRLQQLSFADLAEPTQFPQSTPRYDIAFFKSTDLSCLLDVKAKQ
jgi:hypothetical protein